MERVTDVHVRILVASIFLALVLAACNRPSEEPFPAGRPSVAEHAKRGTSALFIVGDYFHLAFGDELVGIAGALPAAGTAVFLCAEGQRTLLSELLESNGVYNSRFRTFDPSAPALRKWARDVVLAGTLEGEPVVFVSPDRHASTRDEARAMGAILADALGRDAHRVVVTPFVFETGNLASVTGTDGRAVLVVGKKTIFDNDAYARKPWSQGLAGANLLEALQTTFRVDSVVVVGRAQSRPPSRLYFEYHIDMGMVVLRGSRAVVSRLELGGGELARLARAVDEGRAVVSPFLDSPAARDELVSTLTGRLRTVAGEYDDYAATLADLGLEVHRTPVHWGHVLSHMSWTNILQFGNHVVMPLYPDSALGRTLAVKEAAGHMSVTLDVSAIRGEQFRLAGYNKRNHDLYRSLGYDVRPVPEYLHYFMGGIHCFANVLE